jgi:hypothetical protein
MKKTSALTLFLNWLKSTEMFYRPSSQVPGRWQLFEFYHEPEGQLIHVKEEALKVDHIGWEIFMSRDGKFWQESNVPVKIFNGIENGRWSVSANYIKLINPSEAKEYEEVQFAVVKGNLRLLKKETSGAIRFFGFFRRVE